MNVYGGVNPYESYRYGFDITETIQKQRAVSTSRNELTASRHREQMDETTRHVLRLRQSLTAVKQLMSAPAESSEIEVAIPARATSATGLDLDGTATFTTLRSTEEINTTPTSYSTHGPEWTGSSTAQVTISGEYDGSNSTDTLTITSTKSGTHGAVNLQIKVYDSNNNLTDTIAINKSESIDTQYTLSNGLVLTLGEGDLSKNDTFTLTVSDSVGSAVNPDNPFNGTRNSDPDLEPGFSVSDGSFQINGTTIDVNVSDSINTVLNRINQSDAGVTATFDAAAEKVLLTQNTPGSAHDIVLANDTSGFLAAVKLEGAVTIPGQDGSETETILAEEDRFSGVQSGSISVNGVSIDIDVNTDTLTDVLDSITASAADVTASFDSSSQRVSLNSNNSDTQLILDSGTTNFFPAVEISDGTYEPVNETIQIQTGGVDAVNTSDLVAEYAETYNTELTATMEANQDAPATSVATGNAKMLGKLVSVMADSMNALFDGSAVTLSSGVETEAVRNELRSAVASWFDSEGSQFNTDFGIGFDFDKTKESVFKFSPADQSRFESALTNPQSAAAVRQALFGTESDGLFNQLHSALTTAATGMEAEADSTGLFLDVFI
ncbi:MAG: hypothetical protein PVI71_00050 [Desulfobacterales bacterium]|jgi:hypothetical protein